MIDFGFDKIALIGAVALIVIGPEKLPRVARTVGHLLGKAQRYVADVKAEVNRSIELEELKKMKAEFEEGARYAEKSVADHIHQTSAGLHNAWNENGIGGPPHDDGSLTMPTQSGDAHRHGPVSFSMGRAPVRRPRKNWRIRRSAIPHWYKQRHGVRGRVQSGAARVARFRPRGSSFF